MTEAVNARLPDWYAYQQRRQQRRQDSIDAAVREARDQAPDPIAREKAGDRAARTGVTAFDAAEPALSYDEWKAST